MPVAFFMDVHVPLAVTEQLRRRGVDVLTAAEDNSTMLADHDLLNRAGALRRVLVTQDLRFKALAEAMLSEGRTFPGLIFAHQLGITIGQLVRDLELIAKASDADEWLNQVERLPY